MDHLWYCCLLIGLIFPTISTGATLGFYGLPSNLPWTPDVASEFQLTGFGGLGSPVHKRSEEVVQYLPEGGLARRFQLKATPEQSTPKRATLLLDKLMYALQKAMDDKEGGGGSGAASPDNMVAYTGSGLERRGNSHGKVYWRCYFNAVSCF